ncbi:YncE family protein, partial [Streptomyces sp. NPDC058572]|uniref:YncE family protein n=1 Tax=Streptomyces sp. NPDC058572 TaxID=3346546 RepID=UPI0036500E75
MSKVVDTLRREPGTARRRGREISWWTRARTRLATAGVILASVVLPVTNAAPATAADGRTYAYVANRTSGTVSVIDTTVVPPAVTATVNLTSPPVGLAVNPAGTRVYVTRDGTPGTVSVIDTLTNTLIPPHVTVAPTGDFPAGVAVVAVPGTATAQCPGSDFLTGGGFEITGPFPNYFNSKPVINDTWQISGTNPTTQT